jgi:hypothetical protein
MAALDFKEIPEAHRGGGLQDTFELFARDFLKVLGYEVLESPSRGADGGKDLVVVERRTGVGGETQVRWLVSCKHKAHSGASVNPTDELNIRDRVEGYGCQGFIGFYSTLPSSGLSDMISGLGPRLETQIYDRELIEADLLRSSAGIQLAKRYFPVSAAAWINENPAPAKIFATHSNLNCHNCGKNLLDPKPGGVVVIWEHHDHGVRDRVARVYWCCRGNCDHELRARYGREDLIDGWEDLKDIAIPLVFAKWIMAVMNELQRGKEYAPAAFDQIKQLILSIYPYVARNSTEQENERVRDLMELPAALGGLGY